MRHGLSSRGRPLRRKPEDEIVPPPATFGAWERQRLRARGVAEEVGRHARRLPSSSPSTRARRAPGPCSSTGAGSALASAQREVAPHFPRPGWVEQDPLEIWRSQVETAREVLAGPHEAHSGRGEHRPAPSRHRHRQPARDDHRLGARDLAPGGAGDRLAGPAHRPDCERLRAEGREELFTARTGLVLDPYFSGTKLRWILQNAPGALERARRGELAFGTVETWLTWLLSGGRVHVTDATNASRTLLYDLDAGDWDDELLELLEIPRAVLPRVVDSSGVVGETVPGWGPVGWGETAPRGGTGRRRPARPPGFRAACRSPASPATSRPPCSARPASPRAWPR